MRRGVKQWRLWLSLLLSALFLGIAVQGLAWGRVAGTLRTARIAWLIPAMLAYFLTVGLRSWRWAYLLRPLKQAPVSSLFPVMAIGYLGNNIYPFRIGEVVRAYLLRRREEIPISASLATILVERVFDGVAVLVFIFFALPLVPLSGGSLRLILLAGTLAFAAALVIFLLLALRPRLALRALTLFTRFLPQELSAQTLTLGQRFLEGLTSLRSVRALLLLFLSSLLIWLLETAKFWLVMQAFPIALSWFALMLLNGVINLVTALPSAPGFIGTFDLPGIAVLVLYGVPESLAGAYILTLHVVLWLPSIVVGIVYMIREGVRWSDFSRLEETVLSE